MSDLRAATLRLRACGVTSRPLQTAQGRLRQLRSAWQTASRAAARQRALQVPEDDTGSLQMRAQVEAEAEEVICIVLQS